MSQGYHHGIYGYHDQENEEDPQQHHVAQQSRRDKLRMQGLIDPTDEDEPSGSGIYNTGAAGAGSMLQDMFNFSTTAPGPSATDLLASQMQAAAGGYNTRPFNLGFGASWHGGVIEDSKELSHHHPDSAAAMHLFLMNPHQQQQARSPSPQQQALIQNNPFAVVESTQNQGLSLSLSSLLQPDQEIRVRDGVLYFNNSSSNNNVQSQHLQQLQQSHGQQSSQSQHVGYGGGGASVGVVNVLRNSKYSRAAQELLEEFCSVGRGQQFKGKKSLGRQSSISNPNVMNNDNNNSNANASSSSYKEAPPSLSTADRFEHQRKKSKLLSMLDEVDKRYNHYCDQMQMVVNSFDSVMGFGAATPYTSLAQKAMSRHFKCLKDAISLQLKNTCEMLGEKEAAGGSGITKGETPRLRLLDQSLRQQRAFHQMGMMEQEAWRPQRGLPERSVTILRAWLFEHFLHPYPSDADKHLLARQTGLSRNQVSNWFINARVRLWKPMVEDMYQQEAKEQTEGTSTSGPPDHLENTAAQQSPTPHHNIIQNPNPNPNPNPNQQHGMINKRPDPDAVGSSVLERFSTGAGSSMMPMMASDPNSQCGPHEDELYSEYGPVGLGPASRMRLGAPSGDVSLTLGLRHAGNTPDQKNRPFTIRDFGC